MINSEKIRLGKITYYDVEHNGSVVPSVDAYVFMININDTYINPFNILMDLPVYDRMPYSNTTKDGENYGTKIKHVQGEEKDGPCVVLENINLSEYYGLEYMSLNMLKEFMIRSNKYFIDRANLIEDEFNFSKSKVTNRSNKKYAVNKLLDDKIKEENLKGFLEGCEEEKDIIHAK